MSKFFVIDAPTPDPAIGFKKISLLLSTFPIDGMTHYWAMDRAVLSGGKILTVPAVRGGQVLTQYLDTNAPTLSQINGKNVAVGAYANNNQLRTGPDKIGNPMTGVYTAGISIVMMINPTDFTQINSYCNFMGFRIRSRQTTGLFQVQKTGASTVTWDIPTNGLSLTPTVIAFTYDNAANRLRMYKNGVLVLELISGSAVYKEIDPNPNAFYGVGLNTGAGSNAQFGDVAIYNKELSAADVLIASNLLKTKYGIA